MRTLLAYITGISLIYLAGCNHTNQERSSASNDETVLDYDSTEVYQNRNAMLSAENDNDTVAVNDKEMAAPSTAEGDTTYTETEVAQIDTIETTVTYDVNRRTIEQVDTIGATKTYEIERKVIKKTVVIDTLTETVDKEQEVDYEKGNYQVLDEQVEKDTVTETIPYQNNESTNESTEQAAIQNAEEDQKQGTVRQDTISNNADTTATATDSQVPDQSAAQDTTQVRTNDSAN